MNKLLVSLFSVLLSACSLAGQAADDATVAVYKSRGAVQCRSRGNPLPTMQEGLERGGVPVRRAACGRSGRIYPAICGAATGEIVIFYIRRADLSQAKTLGFSPLSGLPEASESPCP